MSQRKYQSYSLNRINRNIVECKCQQGLMLDAVQSELIETLWNVNEYPQEIVSVGGNGINRNIVECKFNQRRS